MHLHRRVRAVARSTACLAALVLAAAACGDDDDATGPTDPDPTPSGPAQLRVLPAEATLTAVGDTLPLAAEVLDEAGEALPDAEVEWSSVDSAVAAVDPTGEVVSLAEGTAPIVAAAGALADTASVTVAPAARRVTIEPSGATLHAMDDTLRLEAEVRDPNGGPIEGAPVEWVSLDTTVAAVDSTGLVAARADGSARIQAVAGQGWDEATVEVRRIPAEIALSPDADTLREGETLSLEAVVVDSNGIAIDDASIEWSTLDPVVATVDATGLVTAVRGGAAAHIGAAAGPAAASAEIRVLGTIAFWRSDPSTTPTTRTIDLVNVDGTDVRPVTDPSLDARRPTWSPDGTRIAFARIPDGETASDIYIVDADGDGADAVALTTDPARDDFPAWSPDGTRIAFTSLRDGNLELYVVDVDGGSAPVRLTDDGSESWVDDEPTWSPDGERIAFRTNRGGDGDYDIWVVDADGAGSPEPLIATADDEMYPAWSPDGTRIAYSADHEGEDGIFVVDADGAGVPRRLTTADDLDRHPSWSPDGTAIVFDRTRFSDGSRTLLVVDADGDAEPRVLLDDPDFSALTPAWRPRP
ncbi:MAG: Ig-like domain-containing protein [Gemmatimonadota bacterium]